MGKELTPWFPGHTTPFHVGVYEIEDAVAMERGRTCFQFWTGNRWGMCCATKDEAALPANATYRSMFQDSIWRGLAKKP
jgi:hypothetical protein